MEDDDNHYEGTYWMYLTDPVLLNIFEYLSAKDIINASATCKNWNLVCHDELLWKHQFQRNFNINPSIGIKPGQTSWFDEYKRLIYHTPSVETEVLNSHSAAVLHVTFSHDGRYFVTCSRDGFILVWNSSYPATIKFSCDMKFLSWKFTQYAEFNESDTLLLVSGGHFGVNYETSGEIAVFSLEDEMILICRILNKPFDIFGTFYGEEYIFSGHVKQIGNSIFSSNIWIYKAYPDITSEHKPLMSRLFRFINVNTRSLVVAKCKSKITELKSQGTPNVINSSDSGDKNFTETNIFDDNFRKKALYENCKYGYKPRFLYNDDYKIIETSSESANSESSKLENVSSYQSDISDDDDEDFDIDSDEDLSTQPEKYLIFTTGSKTTTPHQIGIKRIGRVCFPKILDPGPSLAERIAERKERAQRRPVALEHINIDHLSKNFDSLDHLIELHGQIIGMKLSPDHRYLYVNCRPWPEGYVINHPLDPPPVAQEIDIHVIDLNTFKEVGVMLRAHRAYTPGNECFLIFLDVCNDYIASGSEDNHGYLWDRHYGIALSKFPHNNIVNGVAFNPKDSETLVTVSDDNTIKIWRSRAKTVEYFADKTKYPRAIELLPKRSSKEKRMKNFRLIV